MYCLVDVLPCCCIALLYCLVGDGTAAAETQDAELSQSCLLVSRVVLSKGTFELPEQPLRDAGRFKETMKSVSQGRGHGGWCRL
jgi:hypothetical protein